ncbi:universal stress protein [Geobacter sp. SVR]|uniref:universal stress protein n=1 Tax=Geobacter sp. SVR TaxID=2495594 RepID=UPI00143F034D|nr:universal stress protein [Geobacter sp. SVR]BCS53878.1 hypothetical protein GSVR_21860 [Geobacter sp. SVR]GCF85613.1 universal stress protein [Geobacter sp. SVR]
MDTVEGILVINRLTQYSRDVLLQGVKLARKYDARLSVLRLVSDPIDMKAVNAPGLFIKGEEYKNYLSSRQQYQEELDQTVRQVTRDGFPIKEFVSDKEPLSEIVRIVAEEKIDLILVLAHEEWRLEHLLFGGENDALIRTLPCSILLLKHEPGPVS